MRLGTWRRGAWGSWGRAIAGVLISAVIVVLTALPSLAADAKDIPSGTPPRTVTVKASGRASGPPDLVTVRMGVQTRAPTARDALRANNDRAGALLALLRNNGVSERNVETSFLTVQPEYKNDEPQKIIAYEVNNMVTVRLHNLGAVGDLIDTIVRTVGDAVRVQNIAFSMEDTTKLASIARKQAVEQARAKATELASVAGVKLGRVRSIEESTSLPGPRSVEYSVRSRSEVPIAPGTQDVTVDVTIVYDIA